LRAEIIIWFIEESLGVYESNQLEYLTPNDVIELLSAHTPSFEMIHAD